MNFTVKDNNGNVLSGLQVTPLSEDEIDQPGANTQVPTGTATPTSSATGLSIGTGTASVTVSATTSSTVSASPMASKGAAAGMRDAPNTSMPLAILSIVLASLLAGFLV